MDYFGGMVVARKTQAAVAAIFTFVVLSLAVNITSVFARLDSYVYDLAIESRTAGLDNIMLVTTELAGLYVTAVVVIVGILGLVLIKRSHMAKVLALVSILDILFIDLLKRIFVRIRPDEITQMVHESSFSYPSGHVMSSVFIYGVYVYILSTHISSSRSKIALCLSWVCFVLLVSASRIYLGVHFATDVAASWLLGGLLLSLFVSNYSHIHTFKFKTLMIKLVS